MGQRTKAKQSANTTKPELIEAEISVIDLFEMFKTIDRADKAVFFSYCAQKVFTIEEMVSMIMDRPNV